MLTMYEHALVVKIAARAHCREYIPDQRLPSMLNLMMDVTAVHEHVRKLRLEDLAKADDGNLTHDVFGINRHLDRTTFKLKDCFVPRFAAEEVHDGKT